MVIPSQGDAFMGTFQGCNPSQGATGTSEWVDILAIDFLVKYSFKSWIRNSKGILATKGVQSCPKNLAFFEIEGDGRQTMAKDGPVF